MSVWHTVSPERITPADFVAVIEISKGMNKKYELDKETGLMILDRVLYSSMYYPQNYGFIPRTYCDDHDPLDVMVLCSESIDPNVLVRCYAIGAFTMTDGGELDEKIIAIPFKDPYYNHYRDVKGVPQHLLSVMNNFYSTYKTLENKKTAIDNMVGHEEAEEIIARAMKAYDAEFGTRNKPKTAPL
jgi:inorganic pyrophosphatase